MNFEREWAANEDQLVREAGSLGELLARMSSCFSSLPLAEQGWERLVERAQELPPTLAGFPLWMGFPIGVSRPTALLGVSLLGGTRSATLFQERGRANDADPAARSIASLLDETGVEASPLQRVVGNRVLLEYEIDPARHGQGEPDFFLYPIRPTLAGDPSGVRLGDFQVAYNAVTSALSREPDEGECRHARRAYQALEGGTRVGAIGARSSKSRLPRLAMLGFRKASDVMAYLDRVGWPGRRAALATVLERLEARGALARMQLGLRFDVSAAGLEPTLELQVFSADTIYDHTGWFKDKACWTELVDGLGEEGLAAPEKLPGLDEWSSGAKTLMGRAGLLLLLQRIHHFAIVLNEEGIEQVYAYVFLLLTRMSGRGN